ncbi:TerB N-terminal domain-containing protein [Stomatobaculum longum]|uniref:TerB N-terminal domain-containing protein n=1 Tax=Stomatobaculum longum TaxID=796942 RepID=UPI002805B534|nr:TerB N-terminal domain-containing protein [Stomatobaculum longum]
MRLSELTNYARERHHIEELHKWREMPELSVLVSPASGKWIALLMRERDAGGRIRERCDLRYSAFRELPARDYLTQGFRMPGWLGVRFGAETERAFLLHVFDLAVEEEAEKVEGYYRETAIPGRSELPARIEAIYACEDFLAAARAMEDYEDNSPFAGTVPLYQPEYRDLTPNELRGYFTWRAALRRGEVSPHCDAFVYLYLSELMLGVGAATAAEALDCMDVFASAYFVAGYGSEALQRNFKNWRFEYAVLNRVDAARVRAYENPALRHWDEALTVLREPEKRSDEAVFAALAELGGKKLTEARSVKGLGDRAAFYYATIWRSSAPLLFAACFGNLRMREWKPFSDAPRLRAVCERAGQAFSYQLNELRSFAATGRGFTEYSYLRQQFDSKRFFAFLKEADTALRIRFLRGKVSKTASAAQNIALQEAFAHAFASCEAAEAAQKLAAVPVRREKLADIRAAAAVTTAALLTEAETGAEREELRRREAQELFAEKSCGLTSAEKNCCLAELIDGEDSKQTGSAFAQVAAAAGATPAELANGSETAQTDQAGRTEMLDALERHCLAALLCGESVRAELRAAHCLTSLFAERVNEKLYERFQDICLESEGEELFLVPDYREELETLLRETEK